jgi:hypothetical protein
MLPSSLGTPRQPQNILRYLRFVCAFGPADPHGTSAFCWQKQNRSARISVASITGSDNLLWTLATKVAVD